MMCVSKWNRKPNFSFESKKTVHLSIGRNGIHAIFHTFIFLDSEPLPSSM